MADRVLAGSPCVALGAPRKALRQNRPRRYGGPGEGTGRTGGTTHHGKPFFQRCLAGESRNCASRTTSLARWRLRADPSDDATARRHGNPQLVWIGRVSRASYYRHWVQTAPREAEGELRDRIQRICLAHRLMVTVACEQLCASRAFPVNHKKVRRLMREDNLLAVRRRKWVATTDSRHQLAVFPNLAPWIEPDGSDQLWVADLTYIRLRSELSTWRWCWTPGRGGWSDGH